MDESKRVVPYSKGQALADEFGIQFFETSAKSNLKVDEVSNIYTTLCLPCKLDLSTCKATKKHVSAANWRFMVVRLQANTSSMV